MSEEEGSTPASAMRVLLDEHIDVALRHHFGQAFVVETVSYRGWKSLKNGALLRRAIGEYDAFVTNDQGIPHQQQLRAMNLRFVILEAKSNNIEDHAPLVPKIEAAIRLMASGEVRRVKHQ